MAHGGQIAVPVDIAQRFVEHCTGAPAALGDDGLSTAPHSPVPADASPEPTDKALLRLHSNPLCDGAEPRCSRASEGPGGRPGLALRVSRLSNMSGADTSDSGWPHSARRSGPLLPGACAAGHPAWPACRLVECLGWLSGRLQMRHDAPRAIGCVGGTRMSG